jgi:hypothetical protein
MHGTSLTERDAVQQAVTAKERSYRPSVTASMLPLVQIVYSGLSRNSQCETSSNGTAKMGRWKEESEKKAA